MVLTKLNVTVDAPKSISRLLKEHFGISEEIEGVYSIAGGGTNDQKHRVVRTVSGRHFGIKCNPHGGGAEGERREEAFSKICHAAGTTEASRAVCTGGVTGLEGFDKSPSVITEWVPESKSLDEVVQSPEEKKKFDGAISEVMPQLGRWVATNLHLGLLDRGLKNWVWSDKDRRLATVDTESAFQNARVQDHHSIIDAVYGRQKLRDERGKSEAAIAFEAALKETHSRFLSNLGAMKKAVEGIESAKEYTSQYAGLSAEEFANRVFSELA